MTEFETIEKHETEYGRNNFIEVALKDARGDHGTTRFVSITRGYIDGSGTRRYKTNLTMPAERAIVEWVRDSLDKLNVE